MRAVSTERARWLARHILPHEPALRAWLSRRRVVGLDIDDIIQEAYAILVSKETVEDIRNPKTYAFQVALSVISRHVRRGQVVSIRAVADLERLESELDRPSPEQEAIDRDALHQLATFIAAMPDQTRRAFVLRRVEGLSQREVAQRMGLSENTVEKHISKGIRLLMNRFQRGGRGGLEASSFVEQGSTRPNAAARDQSEH